MEENNINLEVGNRLFELRKEQFLKQIDVANYVGISRNSYARLERGECSATVLQLIKLSELFNVSINYIVGIIEDTNLNPREILQLEKYKEFILYLRKNK